MAANPMYQFNVYRIGPEIKLGEIDISFTNASLFMVISSLAVLIIFNLGAKKKSLIPTNHILHNNYFPFGEPLYHQDIVSDPHCIQTQTQTIINRRELKKTWSTSLKKTLTKT